MVEQAWGESPLAGRATPEFSRQSQARMSRTTSPGHIGQAEIAAGVAVGQLLVVDAQQVQHGGVQVVNRDAVLDGLEAELVGGAVGQAAFDAAAGHPHGEAVGIVIAAVAALGDRRAAEFAAPDHERSRRAGRAASGRESAPPTPGPCRGSGSRRFLLMSLWSSQGWPGP